MNSPDPKPTGVRRIVRATRSSLAGLSEAIRSEAAFRQELLLAIVLVPLAFVLGESGVERALLIGSIIGLLVVELLNTAVEAAVDRTSLEIHPLSKRAKDLGSAAVALALVNVVVIWGLILLT